MHPCSLRPHANAFILSSFDKPAAKPSPRYKLKTGLKICGKVNKKYSELVTKIGTQKLKLEIYFQEEGHACQHLTGFFLLDVVKY